MTTTLPGTTDSLPERKPLLRNVLSRIANGVGEEDLLDPDPVSGSDLSNPRALGKGVVPSGSAVVLLVFWGRPTLRLTDLMTEVQSHEHPDDAERQVQPRADLVAPSPTSRTMPQPPIIRAATR
jgi:hypothetical protein